MPRHGHNQVPEKSKDFFGSIKRLFNSMKTYKYFLMLSLILAMISAILVLISPNKLSKLTDTITLGIRPNISEKIVKDILIDEDISYEDRLEFNRILSKYDKDNIEGLIKEVDNIPSSIYEIIKPKINMNKVKKLSITLAIIYLVSALFNYVQSIIMTVISNKFAKSLRNSISFKINRLSLKYFDNHETGDVLSRVTNDVDVIAHNMNHSIVSLISAITIFVGSVIMMFVTNYVMAITAILSSLIGFVLMGLILGKSQKYFIMRQEILGELNGYIEEIYSGHVVVKSCNGGNIANKEFEKLNDKLYLSNKKSQFLSGIMQPIMMFVGNFGYVAVCVVGAMLVLNNSISFGVIVAFMIYVRMFINPLNQMAQAMTSLQSIAASGERVFEFLDEEEMNDESKLNGKLIRDKVKGKIEFKNVRFGYDEEKVIIKDFNVSIKPGEKVAIVGPTGAGKTTMVNLLMKFYDINSGDILIDDVSIKEIKRENIHELFVMVLQDTWVFEGTIRDNIKFNKKNITDEEIMDACKVVGVDHFIKTLPNGLDTVIGNNDSISQGQKQLLTIARGMIEDEPFLILDEATSNVDTRTEELVQKAMDKLTHGRTSFIIAHRLSTIKNADIILVMNEGNIIEQGTHKELMKKKGFYAELYNAQFKNNL